MQVGTSAYSTLFHNTHRIIICYTVHDALKRKNDVPEYWHFIWPVMK